MQPMITNHALVTQAFSCTTTDPIPTTAEVSLTVPFASEALTKPATASAAQPRRPPPQAQPQPSSQAQPQAQPQPRWQLRRRGRAAAAEVAEGQE